MVNDMSFVNRRSDNKSGLATNLISEKGHNLKRKRTRILSKSASLVTLKPSYRMV